ncbi:hypothetical protein [Luteimonas sp. MC1825]|uniref:hypothetical protein n=1 Tax=Luteimonas sp. MC1825 TaxID=2761107 RepID=UPI00160FB097|nr:hypothetical protein [Luteimonas sp. MC1825]MBB6598726.1 hypothetical protein [Luteimonas sp. MC1825]QOC88891.1 hypothetical protein IDM46_03870 [Luteimonas sp. MC1825]
MTASDMGRTMELDDLKQAWQVLGRQMERQQALNLQLLRESRLERARRGLRPLVIGQLLQLLLGVALVVLGVACWTRNTEVAGLFASGILVHAFGVLNIALAGITLGLVASIDYSAPVLRIQQQMARLLRVYGINANATGLPWWIMWVLVVVAVSGLGATPAAAATPAWIQASLAVGVAGLLGTWLYAWRRRRNPALPGAATDANAHACVADGGDGIRRGQQILDEIARFERE